MAERIDRVTPLVARLRTGGPESIAVLVQRVPGFADALQGAGPLAIHTWGRSGPEKRPIDNVGALAEYLAREFPTAVRILHANRLEHQLLVMAAMDHGRLEKAATRATLGLKGDRAGQARLDRAAAGLSNLVLTDPAQGWVSLLPGVIEQIPLPGITFRSQANGINRDVLTARGQAMGITAAGTRKSELVDAIEAALRDPEWFAATVKHLPKGPQALLGVMIGRGVLDVAETGENYYTDQSRPARYGRGPSATSPLQFLVEHGLVGGSEYDQLCWAWLDLDLALHHGSPFGEWTEPEPAPQPIVASNAIAIPPVLNGLDAVVTAFAASPIKALKTGGLGVKSVRAIAKSQGRITAEVGVLASIGIELGLIQAVLLEQRGRGRNTTFEYEWQPDSSQLAAWRSLPAWARYARLVQQWTDSEQLPAEGKPIERYEPGHLHHGQLLTRRAFIEFLAAFAPGTGLHLDALGEQLQFRYPLWFDIDVTAQMVAESRVLGLIPVDGVIGLTATARQLLTDTAGLEAAIADSPTAFIAQADHTVIAPPGLAPDLDAMLARIATLESDAGARVYRITETSVALALDSGLDAAGILAFLHDHSSVAIAANVERTVTDADARHGQLRIGTSTTWIACDDPVQLARALAVKAAKLTAVSATAAVSTLDEDKVLTALRAKGVTPMRDGAREAVPVRRTAAKVSAELTPRACLLTDRNQIDDLAQRISDAPPDPMPARGPAHRGTPPMRLVRGRGIGDESDDFDRWDDEFE